MKKALVLTIGLVSLMAMSFTLPKQSKFEVVNTQDGSYITNVNLISLEDLQTLESATIRGAAETSWVNTKVWKDAVDQTVKSHKEKTLQLESNSTLNSILSKYE